MRHERRATKLCAILETRRGLTRTYKILHMKAEPASTDRLRGTPRRANALAELAIRGESGYFDELLDKSAYRR